jgi:uncharacterized protein
MTVVDASWKSPSPKLWTMRLLEISVGAVAAMLVAAGAGASQGAPLVGGLIAGVAGCGALTLVFVRNRFRSWRYTEREEDLVVGRGVMFNRMSVVPYGRMQFIDVTSGPIERIFGLATVKLHTAAAATDARIPGLDQQEAARLRDRLAALGEAKAAGL